MQYCTNCGHFVAEGAKFCSNCGTPVTENNEGEKRQTVHQGKIYKCPNCGEVLKSFVTNCPTCGYEIRGAKAAESVRDLESRLESAKTAEEKANIIRHFPIPNTKEDILEFLILASTNANGKLDSEISYAWVAKLEQVIQKARLLIQDKGELARIEKEYQSINKRLGKERTIRTAKKVGSAIAEVTPVLPQVIIVAGWLITIFILLPLCRINLDIVGTNSYQLLLMVDFIAGAVFVPFVLRMDSVLPKLITTAGIILSIVFIIPLCKENLDIVGTNAFQLILIVEIICCVVMLIRTMRYDRKVNHSISIPNGSSLLICMICLAIFTAVYGIGTLRLPKDSIVNNNTSPVISENAQNDDSQGIYTYTIRNYIGKNLGSVGKVSGKQLIEEYGSGEVSIVLVTENGSIIPSDNEELKKQYTVVDQNLAAGTDITLVHLRDSRGKPYSNVVDYQSYDEMILYVAPVGSDSFSPIYTTILPTLDKHVYHIRDYVGRNAASFGKAYSKNRIDEYGAAEMRIVFSSEDGSYVDAEDINTLKNYVITGQDIAPNTELKLEYETDSRGKEYDNIIRSQNYEEINLTVRALDASTIEAMPAIDEASEIEEDKKYTELTVKYKVISGDKAEITGFSGDGNHVTINRKIDGHEVVSIGNKAFKDCTTLESVLFWADVKSIDDYAFSGCTALSKISIPNETTYIGKHAFEGCTNLSSLIIWGSPGIDDYAFSGCESITSLSVSQGTKRIGAHAFDGCKALESVIIWDDDTVIEKDAFANCPNLKDRPVQE